MTVVLENQYAFPYEASIGNHRWSIRWWCRVTGVAVGRLLIENNQLTNEYSV
jgi:hypothetical protein